MDPRRDRAVLNKWYGENGRTVREKFVLGNIVSSIARLDPVVRTDLRNSRCRIREDWTYLIENLSEDGIEDFWFAIEREYAERLRRGGSDLGLVFPNKY